MIVLWYTIFAVNGAVRIALSGRRRELQRDHLALVVDQPRAPGCEPEKPIGCYLFSGPTGGETEVAKQLAALLGVTDDVLFAQDRRAGARRYSGCPSTRNSSSSCGLIGRFSVSPVGRRRRNHLL